MKNALPVLLFALLCCGSHGACAAPGELVGSWELCDDPDGDPKDVVRLGPDGTGSTVNADGRSLNLTYSVHGSALLLKINLPVTRRPDAPPTIEIPLTLSMDKKKLLKPNAGSGTTSIYVRYGNPDKFKCTAK
jgi:hypothetical protein